MSNQRPLFWSDQIAFGITKKFPDRDTYVCASGITPSGTVHVGNFREIITTDFVVKSLIKRGENVRFIYSWDDYDRFRKVPQNVPNEWEQYIGMPVCDVPDPWDCHDSYAEHFEQKLEEELDDMHMDIEFIRQHKMFHNSAYANLIKQALNEKKAIINILNQYRRQPLDDSWYPLRIYCKHCGKDFTEILDYDGEYTITYGCEQCGENSQINFKQNNSVKPPWRVDWPMRWTYENVAFEPGGKDHSAAGSSRDTGKQIVEQVFNSQPPIYQMYDFISLKGLQGKMSSSSGNVITLTDLKQIYTPEMIRFLFSETKPNKEFNIAFDEDIIPIYQKFDTIENVYYNPDAIDNDRKREHWKRVYELAMVEIPAEQPLRAPFDHLAFLAQTIPEDDWATEAIKSLKKTGHIPADPSQEHKKQLITRMEKARNWAREHAPDKYVYQIPEEIPEEIKNELTEEQQDCMLYLAERLREEEFEDSDTLDNRLFSIKDDFGINTGDFFTASYLCLLGREKGPRLSTFIMGLGKERVADILETLE